jgi:hypothetical protein
MSANVEDDASRSLAVGRVLVTTIYTNSFLLGPHNAQLVGLVDKVLRVVLWRDAFHSRRLAVG